MPKIIEETTPQPDPPPRTFLMEWTEEELGRLYVLSHRYEGDSTLPKEHWPFFPPSGSSRLYSVVPDKIAAKVRHIANARYPTTFQGVSDDKFIVTGRRGGKTTAMIAWLREQPSNRVIVTATEREAERLRREYNLEHYQVKAAERVRSGGLRGQQVTVGVDNADWVLSNILNVPVRKMSADSDVLPG